MTIRYLLDENVETEMRAQLEHHVPGLVVKAVGDPEAPPRRTPDPDLIRWCEEHDFHLVTRDRRTMPVHLAEHLAAGRHIRGILTSSKDAPFGRVLEHLILIALVADEMASSQSTIAA